MGVKSSSFNVSCLCLLLMMTTIVGGAPCTIKPLLFNFGDSNSDTGGGSVLKGYVPAFPNGRTFFQEPTGRSCDGRLIIDLFCESLGTKYLRPYFELFVPDFSNGVNFALGGSDTLRNSSASPYTIEKQIELFHRFHHISISRSLIANSEIMPAIYLFDIGQNDIDGNFNSFTFEELLNKTPVVVSNIKAAIKSIYDVGGRNFWVHNTGPAGCLPKNVARRDASTPIDNYGCIARINEADAKFNSELECMCRELRLEMDDDATVVYVDVHSIKLDLIVNATSYGFVDPFTACYNATAGTVCPEAEGGKHLSWDGVHYTEVANMFVASKILSTNFSTPPLNFNFFCN